jgi:glucose-induced degradation protein 8
LLLRLHLVEIIRDCNVDGGDMQHALQFARSNLGPRAATNPKFLDDLEKTMALLMIPRDQLEPPLAAMLDTEVRAEAAERVIGAILATRSRRTMAGIRNLVKLRCWAESKGRTLSVGSIPDNIPIDLNDDYENDITMTT